MNLMMRMLKVQEELGVVAKNLEVKTSKTASYKAVSERDVLDAVKPLEVKYGIYSYPSKRTVIESQTLETTNDNGYVKTTFFTRIETVYRFVNAENPTDYIETTVYSEGIDSQDKGSGKAMTYGDKYALMKMYKISTGDDPDANASYDAKYERKPKVDVVKVAPPVIPSPKATKYATVEDKKEFQNLCKNLGYDTAYVLRQIGWEDNGEKTLASELELAKQWVKEQSVKEHGSN